MDVVETYAIRGQSIDVRAGGAAIAVAPQMVGPERVDVEVDEPQRRALGAAGRGARSAGDARTVTRPRQPSFTRPMLGAPSGPAWDRRRARAPSTRPHPRHHGVNG